MSGHKLKKWSPSFNRSQQILRQHTEFVDILILAYNNLECSEPMNIQLSFIYWFKSRFSYLSQNFAVVHNFK